MSELIERLKTVKDCEVFAKNANSKGREDLAVQARRRAVELRAEAYGAKTQAEVEALQAIYAYEEVLSQKNGKRTRATRTWQMIDRHGIIASVERAVNRNVETQGYRALVDMGMEELAFEAVIIRYPDVFSAEAIATAKERLLSWKSDHS